MTDPNGINPPPSPAPAEDTSHLETPNLSTAQTLTGIFFRPATVFESMRLKPRFLIAGLILIVVGFIFNAMFLNFFGFETIVRSSIENSSQSAGMSPEQREQVIAFNAGPAAKVIAYAAPPIIIIMAFTAGAALYLLGTLLMGKMLSYKEALAVWIYSTFPPYLLLYLSNIVAMLLTKPDKAAIPQALRGGGVITLNPSSLVDGTLHPVLATALVALDLWSFYGLFLATLGIRKVTRLPWWRSFVVVIAVWALGFLFFVGKAALFG